MGSTERQAGLIATAGHHPRPPAPPHQRSPCQHLPRQAEQVARRCPSPKQTRKHPQRAKNGEMSNRFSIQTARTCQSENGPLRDQGRRCTSLQTTTGSSERSSSALLATPCGHPTVPGHSRCNLHLGAGWKHACRIDATDHPP